MSVLGQMLNLLRSILTILLTCPNNDTLVCYSNNPFLTVYGQHQYLSKESVKYAYLLSVLASVVATTSVESAGTVQLNRVTGGVSTMGCSIPLVLLFIPTIGASLGKLCHTSRATSTQPYASHKAGHLGLATIASKVDVSSLPGGCPSVLLYMPSLILRVLH